MSLNFHPDWNNSQSTCHCGQKQCLNIYGITDCSLHLHLPTTDSFPKGSITPQQGISILTGITLIVQATVGRQKQYLNIYGITDCSLHLHLPTTDSFPKGSITPQQGISILTGISLTVHATVG